MLSVAKKNSRNPLKLLGQMLSNPARVIVCSFALLILLGSLLLMLPISTRNGGGAPFQIALFTATSATCVTGLAVVDTFSYFTIFGQVVILTLIQLGGLGLVTFATFFNIAIRKRVGLKSLYLAQESVSSDSMSDIGRLMKMIITITFGTELAGALVLMTVFVPQYQGMGVYVSVFIAISSYCNAGFDVLGFQGPFSGLTNYQSSPVVLLTVMALIICGGLGFIVWQDLYYFRQRRRLTLHTKIVLGTTAVLIAAGAVLLGGFEWNNPQTLGPMSSLDKILNSFFMSVSARTAGFNTVPLEHLHGISKVFMVALMFIGAAPGSTGGGIKVTTAYVLLMTVVCVIRGKEDTVIDRRRVDQSVVYKAMAVVFIALLAVCAGSATIFFTTHSGGVTFSEIDAVFEAVSAFSTAGLTCGISGAANRASRMALILIMFLGRVGPVSMALSLAMQPQNKSTVMPEAKIMVG